MKKAWLMAIVAICSGVVFAISLFKVPPTMVLLMQEFNVSIAVIGLVMTAIAITSTVIALPGGAIMQKIGPKNMGLAAMACTLIGNLIGTFSSNFSLLIFSRAIEGFGFGLISLVVPTIIAAWFPAQKRGLPMAIWSLWVSIGMLIIFRMTNVIVPQFGWKGSWWLVTILFIIVGILFALIVRLPKEGEGANEPKLEQGEKVSLLEGFKSPMAWLLAIIFIAFGWPCAAFSGFYSTFLQQALGLDMAAANSIVSYATIGMIIGGILIGLLLNRIKNKNHGLVLIIIMALAAVFFYLQFEIKAVAILVPFVFASGVIQQLIPPTIFTIAPTAAGSPERIAATMGIISLGANLSGILSNTFTGPLVASFGGVWSKLSIFMLVITLVGVVAAIVLNMLLSKNYKAQSKVNPQV
ncbi:MFS transporter [Dehalobacter sp. DCM]|uniref:MFS transporter n=1 Tax=Dehalobacter sp. DCM TaxID=2907827 RepID=UPI00308198E4|nr:MFS transporter [Dehalobacter sp. DCM]